jgi:threonine/homoserine/homoserine lactone efflux protein
LGLNLAFGIVGVGGAILLIWMGAGMVKGTKVAILKLQIELGERSRPILAGVRTKVLTLSSDVMVYPGYGP